MVMLYLIGGARCDAFLDADDLCERAGGRANPRRSDVRRSPFNSRRPEYDLRPDRRRRTLSRVGDRLRRRRFGR